MAVAVRAGVVTRITSRLLVLGRAIWHNWAASPGQAATNRLPPLSTFKEWIIQCL